MNNGLILFFEDQVFVFIHLEKCTGLDLQKNIEQQVQSFSVVSVHAPFPPVSCYYSIIY